MLRIWCILAAIGLSMAFPKYNLNNNFALSHVRIINGQPASPHQFPYQVGIKVSYNGQSDFCGGSLISNNYVLTAAHCVKGATQAELIFGAHNVTDPTEKSQIRLVSKNFIVHESWNPKTLQNDIALIKLPSSVKETKEIKIVALAKGTNKYENVQATVAGWGLTRTSGSGVTPILQYIVAQVMGNDDCRKVDSGYSAIIKDVHLCLSGGASKLATCQGDSGGPLAVNGVQIGIVSFGAKVCESGKPSVFARLTEYHDWIIKNSDVKY